MISYELKCEACGFRLRYNQGVLMSFQRTNMEILSEMKAGTYGISFKKAADEHPNARAEHSSELLRCPDCGTLTSGGILKLVDKGKVLIENPHICNKCGTQMDVVSRKDESKLMCPKCKSSLLRNIPTMCID